MLSSLPPLTCGWPDAASLRKCIYGRGRGVGVGRFQLQMHCAGTSEWKGGREEGRLSDFPGVPPHTHTMLRLPASVSGKVIKFNLRPNRSPSSSEVHEKWLMHRLVHIRARIDRYWVILAAAAGGGIDDPFSAGSCGPHRGAWRLSLSAEIDYLNACFSSALTYAHEMRNEYKTTLTSVKN